jgi:hypothetical protein
MKTTLAEWPDGTPDYVNHSVLKDYIQTIASTTGVDQITRYDTRVTKLEKSGGKWHLAYSRMQKADGQTPQMKSGEQVSLIVFQFDSARFANLP